MDHHVRKYYRQSSDESPQGNFHSVIALHEEIEVSWNKISSQVPLLSRGWFELSRLSCKDRIEFTRDYWLSKLPYREGLDAFLNRFFASLDDIGVYLTQKKFEDPFEVHLVYSIKGDNGFFRGANPITEKKLNHLQKFFSEYMLPSDYIAFLKIHDGFCKTTDCTGLIQSELISSVYEKLQKLIQAEDLRTTQGNIVNPKTIIPFYESFGMPFFQCFWAEWYPEEEMGNVYFSSETKTISDVFSGAVASEVMAFSTFTDWLIFYLERVD